MREKTWRAGLLTAAFAVAAVLFMGGSVSAEASQRIRIKGAKTVKVGKTIELDADIANDDFIRDRNIVWKSNKPSVAKVLRKRGDDTKIKGKKVGTAKITVRVKGTSLKATFKVKVKKAASSTNNNTKSTSGTSQTTTDKQKLADLKKELTTLYNEIKDAQNCWGNYTKYYEYKRKLDAIDYQLEYIENKYEHQWGTEARQMEYEVELVEDQLDNVEDYMEYKFGIDD